MNLDLDAGEVAFRDEVREFLQRELQPELAEAGRRATSVFTDPAYSLPWQRILHAKGWVAPHWPVAHGGPGWSEMQRYIFAAECTRANAPNLAPMGLRMVGPCIMRYGTDEQKRTLLPRILSGEDYWCQGYSEPGSGSDLASLRTRADSDGDDYILNGSKIWTTHAGAVRPTLTSLRVGRVHWPSGDPNDANFLQTAPLPASRHSVRGVAVLPLHAEPA